MFALWNLCNSGLMITWLSKFLLFSALLFPASGKGTLITITEDTWRQLLDGEWMVEFYAPWCPSCKSLEPVWMEFANWSDELGIKVASVDVTTNPGLSGRFIVTALPTIFHVKDGVFRQYTASRDKDSFLNFIEEKKWMNLEPLSSWKAPQSFQMSVVSYFFKLSMTLRGMHNTMVEKHGLPYWASYVLFGLATVIVGSLLGLIIVCMIDFMFPAKPPMAPYPAKKNDAVPDVKKIELEEEDVIEDDTKEDVIQDNAAQLNTFELRQRVVDQGAEITPEAM